MHSGRRSQPQWDVSEPDAREAAVRLLDWVLKLLQNSVSYRTRHNEGNDVVSSRSASTSSRRVKGALTAPFGTWKTTTGDDLREEQRCDRQIYTFRTVRSAWQAKLRAHTHCPTKHKNNNTHILWSAAAPSQQSPRCSSCRHHTMSDRCEAANQRSHRVKEHIAVMWRSSRSGPHVRLLLAPPGLAGLEDDSSFSAARLLFLFSASFPPPPPAAAPPSLPPFSLSRSLSLSRLLLVRSDIFTEELLPEEKATHKR